MAEAQPGHKCGARRSVNRKVFRGRHDGAIVDHYSWREQDELGAGNFGKVFQARSLLDAKRVVAVKQVSKTACEDLRELWSEIAILSELDHPNVLRFLEAFEDYRHIYIVTEVCKGGDLLSWMGEVVGDLKFARRVSREVTNALAFCHERGICHRDLKLDNVLLVRAMRCSPVRVADFGVAHQVQEVMCKDQVKHAHELAERLHAGAAGAQKGKKLTRMVSFKGTPEYMAPEVLAVLNASVNASAEVSFYDFRCDVWSLGVVVHALIVGREPFALEEVAAYVENGTKLPALNLEENVDDLAAQEFLRRCLKSTYLERPHAAELLNDTFLQRREADVAEGDAGDANEGEHCKPWLEPQSPQALRQHEVEKVTDKVQQFMQFSHFKRAALTAAVRHLNAFEHEELRRVFQAMDTNNSGTITASELRDALHAHLTTATSSPGREGAAGQQGVLEGEAPLVTGDWLESAFWAMDSDLSGEVDFTEFLAAAMDSRLEERKDLAWAAFRSFDLNGNGSISKDELGQVLEDENLQTLLRELQEEQVHSDSGPLSLEQFMTLADTDKDGDISFQEFLEMLKLG